MKTNIDRRESEMATALSVETAVSNIREFDFSVEELEDVIAPRVALNHRSKF